MASEDDLKSYYQVPSKPLAEFNITNDKIYTQTLNENDVDTNFGNLAALSAVPLATTSTIGGFKLYVEDDGSGTATISPLNKQYGIQIRDSDKVGFVYVPWLNTLYKAAPTNYLCVECISEANGHDGGLFQFDISCVSVTLIAGAGDMLSGDGGDHDHSKYRNVSVDISQPLQANIDAAIISAENNLRDHARDNNNDFDAVRLSIHNLSDDLGADFYRKNETSCASDLYAQFTSLSDDFKKYLNNTLYSGVHTNPAYLSNETSSNTELNDMFDSLSDTVDDNYMHTTDAYYTTETSSKVELANMFDTKQNNLNINSQISKTGSYTDNDVATVRAITDYITSQLDEHTATFQGHFNSLAQVPEDGNARGTGGYTSPPPDLNDYIFVNIIQSDLNIPGFNFEAKDVGVWRMKITTATWDFAKGRRNWVPEYKISDSAFTAAQIAALNSGIDAIKVAKILSYSEICNKLQKDYPNIIKHFGALAELDRIVNNIIGSGAVNQIAVFNGANSIKGMDFAPQKEKWIFELQDGTTKVSKYILAQNV